METPLIFNIQKFSLHDGPGIRTTLFFKGCPIKCAWCHNPESQSYEQETMIDNNKKEKVVGKAYSINELLDIISEDDTFYQESNGGVTLSGGEIMTQEFAYVEELVKKLKEYDYHIAIDTCGVCDFERFLKIDEYVDLYLYDLKILNDDLHKEHVGVSNRCVLRNLQNLSDLNSNIWLRLILIDEINTIHQDIENLLKYLDDNRIKVELINLLPFHKFGQDKYGKLDKENSQERFNAPSDTRIEEIKQSFTKAGYTVKIGG